MGAALLPVDLGPVSVEKIVSGVRHNCVLLVGGSVKCFGRNLEAQLGLGDALNRGDGTQPMGEALLEVSFDGKSVVDIAAGENHTCAALDDGSVRCWGGAVAGALGNGLNAGIFGDAPEEMGAGLPAVALQ